MLHEFLRNNRAELIARCRRKVAARRAPGASAAELAYGVPLFLDQLTAMLERENGSDAGEATIGDDATRHGAELLRHDFTIEQVVHDYGDLCQSITEVAGEQGAPITVREFG